MYYWRQFMNLGTISEKLLGGDVAPKLVYFVQKKGVINLSEMAPECCT